jgi:hypothetical protein
MEDAGLRKWEATIEGRELLVVPARTLTSTLQRSMPE